MTGPEHCCSLGPLPLVHLAIVSCSRGTKLSVVLAGRDREMRVRCNTYYMIASKCHPQIREIKEKRAIVHAWFYVTNVCVCRVLARKPYAHHCAAKLALVGFYFSWQLVQYNPNSNQKVYCQRTSLGRRLVLTLPR